MKCLPVITFLGVFPAIALGGAPTAESLIEGMEDILWSDSNHGLFTMRIESEYWARERKLEAWWSGAAWSFRSVRIIYRSP